MSTHLDPGAALAAGLRAVIASELYATVPLMIQAAFRDAGRADVFTPDQLAEKWSMSRASVDRLVAAGKLKAIQIEGARGRVIRAVDAAAYLEERARAARTGLRAAS